MSIEGQLRIELQSRNERIQRVRILSSRPLQLPLLFEGKRVEEVLQTIPMLYSICANAQASAAAIACRQAVGASIDPHIPLAESMLVWFETAREHLWRILIDWPGHIGEAVDRQQLPGLSLLIPDAKQALFDTVAPGFTLQPQLQTNAETLGRLICHLSQILDRAVFGLPAARWSAMSSVEELERWIADKETAAARYLAQLVESGIAQLGQTKIQALPAMDDEMLHQRLQQPDADAFIASPEWEGGPCETSSLTRQADHPLVGAMLDGYGMGLLTRLVARLLELASIPERLSAMLRELDQEAAPVSSAQPVLTAGKGLGVTEAARGRLVHCASLSGDVIERYQILAPTEWNFHPGGLVAQGLQGLACGCESAMRRQASLFISAVDPCVGYSLELL